MHSELCNNTAQLSWLSQGNIRQFVLFMAGGVKCCRTLAQWLQGLGAEQANQNMGDFNVNCLHLRTRSGRSPIEGNVGLQP